MESMVEDADLELLRSAVVGSAHPEILISEARVRRAQLSGDIAALDELIAETILFTGPDGQLGSKEADLLAHGSGMVRFRDHVPEELRVLRVRDDVMITALLAVLRVEVSGQVTGGRYRYTRVWARDDHGSWRVVGGHVSRVSEG